VKAIAVLRWSAARSAVQARTHWWDSTGYSATSFNVTLNAACDHRQHAASGLTHARVFQFNCIAVIVRTSESTTPRLPSARPTTTRYHCQIDRMNCSSAVAVLPQTSAGQALAPRQLQLRTVGRAACCSLDSTPPQASYVEAIDVTTITVALSPVKPTILNCIDFESTVLSRILVGL
jgi:hypothetical protein